jgi:hypothetical protein
MGGFGKCDRTERHQVSARMTGVVMVLLRRFVIQYLTSFHRPGFPQSWKSFFLHKLLENDFNMDGHVFLRNFSLCRDDSCWTNFGIYAIWCYRLRTRGARPPLLHMSLWLDNHRDNLGSTFRFLQYF